MRFIQLLLLALFVAGPLMAENRVLYLDGRESYVQLPGHIFDGLEEATVEAWDFFSQWFAFGADDQWRAMGGNHFDDTSRLQFFIYIGQDELHILRLGGDLPLGQWCHMADVYQNLPDDLAQVVAAWDNLPEAVKVGILAMVEAEQKP